MPTPLNRQQILGFWAAWCGWVLDGMDSVIYALVLSPAMRELLPNSGVEPTPVNVAFAGSILFALFLLGWGLSFVWGPIADRFGRARCLAATILVFSIFTGAAAFAHTVWQLGLFRFLAGIGIGGEWAMAGTFVAESWPEDRRKTGAGYLQTGYYAGFFLAAALNYTIGAQFGWRAMFLCGAAPVLVTVFTLARVREPSRWTQRHAQRGSNPLAAIFSALYLRRTIVNTALVSIAIVGLWAGTVYEPTAILALARKAGLTALQGTRLASLGTAILSVGTILGCLLLPPIAERIGRRKTLGLYFAGMASAIPLAFGWAYHLPAGLTPFLAVLFFLGLAGGNFAMFSLWLPEQYPTEVRATAFAFCTSFGRFIGAGANFAIAALIQQTGSLGQVISLTAIPFFIGLAVIPFAKETRNQPLP
ncbi:MAG TPA: MFS transporter [Rhizomicrobium sp.]|nr:MFS transporter [Rhizomicrobium sp.]